MLDVLLKVMSDCSMAKLLLFGTLIEVRFTSSAFKHGCTKKDLLSALSNNIYDETLQLDPNKTLVVGFDTKGNLVELVFNVVDHQSITVFHAMPCRKTYLDRIGKRRQND